MIQGPKSVLRIRLAIIFTVVTFYLIGDGLNRVLSPKLRNLGKEG